MKSKYNYFLIEITDHICLININRPESLNSLNIELINEFTELIDVIENNIDINVVIITGVGKSFVAGADIKEMLLFDENQAKEFSKLGSNLFLKIETLNKPIIAAINGYAIGGGCELALSCDIRLASISSKFSSPEINLGIIPGFSGTKRLSNVIGISKAKELIFTGKTINAKEALEIGLVNSICESEELMNEAFKMANIIKEKNSNIIAIAKQAINANYYNDINESIENESNYFAQCFQTGIPKEYMNKFLKKND